jgi:hypothetical protein
MDAETLRRIALLEDELALHREALVEIKDLLVNIGDQTGLFAQLGRIHDARIKQLEGK